ncbi:MAG: class I SAM-dependent methyltransferase [Candidatus Krumholzibacteria bacterium]|nr:class I SAM-dependent methyltransferase [Candidatus Krumholzibacteria bacterium]
MEWYEAAFDRFYTVMYSHRDTKEAALAIETFGHFLQGKSPVLDLASGNGRYLQTLLDAGHEAYGLDLSHYLLRSSVQQWGHEGRIVQGDMRQLPFAHGSFGSAINMFTSFGYFSVDTDNLLVFREVHRVLKPSGVFLFDFINATRISAKLLDETRRQSMGFDIHERRVVEGHGKYLVKHAKISDLETKKTESIEERLRLYSKKDLLLMFGSVGFQVIDIFGDYHGNAFVSGVSDRLIIVCEKP